MTLADISLGGWFAARAARSASRRALTFEGTTRTYGQLLDRVDRLAAALRDGGLCHGDRVGFLGFNQPALLETMLAAARVGAIFVPYNFRLTGPELTHVIADAGIHTLVVDAAHLGTIDEVRERLPVRRYLRIGAGGGHWQDYDVLLTSTGPLPQPDPVAADEVALIMYTSGTTGRPKGVMLTHANLWWNNTNLMHLYDVLADDVTLVVAPMFHIAGLNVNIFTTWRRGGEVLLHRSFDPGACLADIPRYRVTTMFGVPAMFQALTQHPDFDATDLTSLRVLIGGGAPVPEALIRRFHDRGVGMLNGYGLTETAPSCCFLTADYSLSKLGSIGQPPLLSELRIVDLTGVSASEPGVRGEICVRGPNVMKGYWNQPEATAEAIDAEGWFHTGDVGYFDEDGFVFLADRLKDVVISGGENVYPAEVENVLFGHPAVRDVAVIGLPDKRWGEAVVAVVVPEPGQAVQLEELREFGGRSLARYKLPTRLQIVPELPRNPAGKVLKYELRHTFQAGQPVAPRAPADEVHVPSTEAERREEFAGER